MTQFEIYRDKRTVQKTVDKNVNMGYLTSLGGCSFPPLHMAWTVTKSTLFHHQNVCMTKAKGLSNGHCNQSLGARMSPEACWTFKTFNGQPLPLSANQLPAPCSPLYSGFGSGQRTPGRTERAEGTYFSMIWGQKTTDLFKERDQPSKENCGPSPKRWE